MLSDVERIVREKKGKYLEESFTQQSSDLNLLEDDYYISCYVSLSLIKFRLMILYIQATATCNGQYIVPRSCSRFSLEGSSFPVTS